LKLQTYQYYFMLPTLLVCHKKGTTPKHNTCIKPVHESKWYVGFNRPLDLSFQANNLNCNKIFLDVFVDHWIKQENMAIKLVCMHVSLLDVSKYKTNAEITKIVIGS